MEWLISDAPRTRTSHGHEEGKGQVYIPDRKNATVVNTPRIVLSARIPDPTSLGNRTPFSFLLLLSISLVVVVYRQSLFEHERR